MTDKRITPEMVEIAQELNDEFIREYADNPKFRAQFNDYLRGLGVHVAPDQPPRTLKDIGGDGITRH